MESSKNSRVWTIALVAVAVLTIWFLLPQLGVIIFTALMAFVFYPLYKRLKRKNGGVAATLTLLTSFLVVVIPLIFIIIAAIGQLASFSESASQSQYWSRVPEIAKNAIDVANDIIAPLTGNAIRLTDQNIIEFLRTAVPTVARATGQFMLGLLGSLPQLGIAFILYVFLFVEFLRYGPELLKKIESISPFSPVVTQHYFEKIGLMAKAMVTGQLIISMIISVVAAGLLAFLGYGHLFFILFVLFTILNFIPLGSGIVLVPLALYAMFTGQFWPGLVVIVLYYLFGNIEPVLRTWLIPKKIQLSVGLTMLATFCGIAYFGLLGVVYGPIIMIVIVTTLEFYSEYKSKHITPRGKEA